MNSYLVRDNKGDLVSKPEVPLRELGDLMGISIQQGTVKFSEIKGNRGRGLA